MLAVAPDWTERVRSLLDAPAPAILSTYRKDGSASVSPVWFRWEAGAFEVVIAEGDVKLRHLARDPRCVLVVFEAVPPFRGVEVRGEPELVACDVTSMRASIAGRYLGAAGGERFAQERRSKPGVLLRLAAGEPRVWDLAAILPDSSPPAVLRIGSIVLRVDDLQCQTEFWQAALGYVRRDDGESDDFVLLGPSDGPGPNLSLDRVRSSLQIPPRLHLDLYTEDQVGEIARLRALGATEVHWDKRPPDADYVILADPEGNRFCVVDTARSQ